jgi:hypothetical protein
MDGADPSDQPEARNDRLLAAFCLHIIPGICGK